MVHVHARMRHTCTSCPICGAGLSNVQPPAGCPARASASLAAVRGCPFGPAHFLPFTYSEAFPPQSWEITTDPTARVRFLVTHLRLGPVFSPTEFALMLPPGQYIYAEHHWVHYERMSQATIGKIPLLVVSLPIRDVEPRKHESVAHVYGSQWHLVPDLHPVQVTPP